MPLTELDFTNSYDVQESVLVNAPRTDTRPTRFSRLVHKRIIDGIIITDLV